MRNRDISLPEPLRQFVEDQVANGNYQTADQYIEDLIRRAQQQDAEQERLEQLLLEACSPPPPS